MSLDDYVDDAELDDPMAPVYMVGYLQSRGYNMVD